MSITIHQPNKLITIFTPTYNRGEKLKELYKNILEQSYPRDKFECNKLFKETATGIWNLSENKKIINGDK